MKRTLPHKNLTRRATLGVGLAGLVLPGSVWPQDTDRELEGGLGGTGIVGILTDFGSLVVAGNTVETSGATPYTDGFGPVSEGTLKLGQSLTVEAARQNGALVAQRVHVTHPLVGQIARIDAANRQIFVNGVSVHVPQGIGRFRVGSRVAVSGLWNGTMVEASNLSKARSPQDLVSGTVNRRGGGPNIGGVLIAGRSRNMLKDASFATVIGNYDPTRDQMGATQIKSGRFFGVAGALTRLSIEGYLEPSPQAPGFRIAGLGHSFERNLSLSQFQAQRMLFNGPYTGRFAANTATILPENTASRRRVLRALGR